MCFRTALERELEEKRVFVSKLMANGIAICQMSDSFEG